jgi:hypothetical protein
MDRTGDMWHFMVTSLKQVGARMLRNRFSLSFLAALSVAPAMLGAETLTWGQIDLKAGVASIGGTEGNATNVDNRSPTTYDLSGRIGADWGAFGAQLDLNYSARDIDADEYTGYYWGKWAAIRANYDLSPVFALGAVYGAGDLGQAGDYIADFEFYALEGSYSAGAGLYGLQLGAFDSSDPDDTDTFHDGTFVRAAAVYSLGNGGVVEGELAYFDGKQDSGGSYGMYAFTWGVEYSRQFASRPLAWSIGLDGGRFTNGDSGDNGLFNEARLTLGLTAWFGDGDLASAKKRGIFSQPEFGRIVEAGNSVD